MPRQRTVSDEALLDAALGIVHTSGPDALTFAALSPHAGLAASTIVQRFGTKAALLHAALARAWDRLDDDTATAIDRAPAEPSGVIDLLMALTGQYDAHDFADQLLVLREDLRDPILRERGEQWLATLTEAIERRLDPVPGGTAGLGELILAQWQGTLTVWSFTRQGPLIDVVRDALEDLFDRLVLDRR